MFQEFAQLPIDQVRWMGDRVQVGRFTYFHESVRFLTWVSGEKIVVGDFCSVADGAMICVGGNHRTELVSTFPFDNILLHKPNPTRTYKTTRDTLIGNDVWIAARACVLGGAHIGDGAVVSTGAVVSGDVPPYAIMAGNPAQVVRYRFSKTTVERLQRLKWWDWPNDKIRANVEWFYRPIQEFLDHFETNR